MEATQSDEGTHAYELQAQPVHSLSQRVMTDVFTMVRSDVRLALSEIDAKARDAGSAARGLGVAAVLGTVASGSLAAAAIAALSRVMPVWRAALVVAGATGLPALALTRRGVARLEKNNGILPTSILSTLVSGSTPLPSPEDAQRQAAGARADLDRTVNALSAKGSSPSPVRDAILSDLAITLSTIVKARAGNR